MKRITLAHGAGGRLTADLIRDLFVERLGNPYLDSLGDSAVVDLDAAGRKDGATGPVRMALTTDGFVVTPIFFPGGDIGRLAVSGTINDLAAAGARPAYLTAGFIIEEGLPVDELARVVDSMAAAAREAGVSVVAGDTKVVERGGCDKLFIVTSGVGWLLARADLGPDRVRAGDRLVLNGSIGLHGVAVLSRRPGLAFETSVRTDCGPVAHLTTAIIEELGPAVRWMRDPTRGGLATVAVELGDETGLAVVLDETHLPVSPAVRGACDMLGLDPLYLANEGKVLIVTAPEAAGRAVEILKSLGQDEAAIVGTVQEAGAAGRADDPPARASGIGPRFPLEPGAYMRTAYGGTKPLDRLSGEPLPRIC